MKDPLLFCRNGRISILLLLSFLISMSTIHAQTFPAGFNRIQVTGGLSSPTAMTQTPDGRFLVTQQGGALKVIKNGLLLPASAINLIVQSNGERGLIGIAVDPDFDTNNFVYLYYTVSASTPHNRVSRFTFNGDVIQPGSETVLLDLNDLSSANNHNGGSMAFGADGKLYIAVGENANGSNSQTLDNYLGKILRVNKDGSVPIGNPFSGSASRDRIWAYGLRNPYTISFKPGTSTLFINDVGNSTWEEINDGSIGGKNFGWSVQEGFCTSNCSGYTDPQYVYGHGSGEGVGCAITGGTFFTSSTTMYPSTYAGKYFFMDYCNSWINYIDPSNPTIKNSFATNIGGSSLGIITGKDGNLYYLSRDNGSLYKVDYTTTGLPVITSQPQSITKSPGLVATFSVTANGTAPLSYQWSKNGSTIAGATSVSYSIANVQVGDAGTYNVTITNSAGNVTSNNATLTVSANALPVASITAPANNSVYRGGKIIDFKGTGMDAEDGDLPARGLSWSVIFHHDTHTHPGPAVTVSSSGKTGSFTIPTLGETSANVWYELILNVTDSNNDSQSTSVRLNPVTSSLTIASNPLSLQVKLDDQPITTPYTTTAVSGMVRNLDVITPQTMNGSNYVFNNWSNTVNARQDITVSDKATTYTAIFYRSADMPANTTAGLDYAYYESNWNALPDFNSLTPVKTGVVSNVDLSPKNASHQFAFRYSGYINTPADGLYTFYTSSDDGSQLFIGNTLIVDNDGLHGAHERSGSIYLKAGKHTFAVTYFDQAGGQALSVSYAGPGIAKQNIPAMELYRSVDAVSLVLEAESAVKSGVVNSSRYAGYTGTGFGDYINPSSDYIEWNASIPSTGVYTIGFRYALGNGGDRPLEIKVNDVVVSSGLSFPKTTTWTSWNVVAVSTTLHSGINTIRATAIGSSGANIDHIEITSSSSMMARTSDYEGITEDQTEITMFPVPTRDVVKIKSIEKIIFIDAFNMNGTRLNVDSKQNTENEIELNTSALKAGLYLVKIKAGGKSFIKKMPVIN